MMRRNMQANEIRTNIVFEFAVVGESSVRQLYADILNVASHSLENGRNARLVGVNLKKPTASVVYLTNTTVEVDDAVSPLPSMSREVSDVKDEEDEELEEDLDND